MSTNLINFIWKPKTDQIYDEPSLVLFVSIVQKQKHNLLLVCNWNKPNSESQSKMSHFRIKSLDFFLRKRYSQNLIQTNTNFVFNINYRRQIEEMYYSPRKNIEAFIESKNEQIQSLKQKILGSRVTYEDMDNAKSRLTILKSSYLNLQKEDHLELKQVLKNSLQAVNDLVKRKNRLQEELESQQKQTQEMCELETELLGKQQKAGQFYKQVCMVKDKLMEKKQKKNRQICDLEEQIVIRRKELTMERQIGDQLNVAKAELKSKMTKVNIDLAALSQQNKKMRETIRKQLEQLTKLEHDNQKNELKIENLQLKIEKQEKHIQNLQQKIDASQGFMQRFSEDKLIYLKESETAANIEGLLKMCLQNNEKKQREQKQCQQQIDDLDKKIHQGVYRKQQLSTQIVSKKQNLRELKQKGSELKSILNSIFHQDSNVLKLLADKKVYQSEQPAKKTNPTPPLKQDMLDLVATSDNFFMTNTISY